MRYAEVLLLAAEANLEAGNTGVALKDINEIRIRAKETPLTSVTLDDIKTEKRLELCLESTRFQDLRRGVMPRKPWLHRVRKFLTTLPRA